MQTEKFTWDLSDYDSTAAIRGFNLAQLLVAIIIKSSSDILYVRPDVRPNFEMGGDDVPACTSNF